VPAESRNPPLHRIYQPGDEELTNHALPISFPFPSLILKSIVDASCITGVENQ